MKRIVHDGDHRLRPACTAASTRSTSSLVSAGRDHRGIERARFWLAEGKKRPAGGRVSSRNRRNASSRRGNKAELGLITKPASSSRRVRFWNSSWVSRQGALKNCGKTLEIERVKEGVIQALTPLKRSVNEKVVLLL